jgi:hypothetical protein
VGGGGEVTDFAVVYIFAPKQNKIDVKSGTWMNLGENVTLIQLTQEGANSGLLFIL